MLIIKDKLRVNAAKAAFKKLEQIKLLHTKVESLITNF